MKLLVTGGAGFIGSNFIRFWLERHPKDTLTNLDKLTYAGHLSSLKDVTGNPGYKFIKGDICDPKVVAKAMRGTDLIIHFAAETHVDRSILGASEFVRTNILGTQVLLEAARQAKVHRFHLVSTDEVFGSLTLRSVKKFDESTVYSPHNPYSASKAAADHLVRSYFHTFGLPVSITNCSNNFGPFQDPEKFIPRMIIHLINGKKVPVYGNGLQIRDWLHVIDHCRAIELVIAKGRPGQTYCVGGLTHDINNLQVTKKVLKIFGQDDASIEHVADRPGHDIRYAVNWTKINRELGWKPEHSFDDWLKSTVDWYKDNSWWWKPLLRRSESIYK
jgi:dTDP-glucose 4,6-dehydratase